MTMYGMNLHDNDDGRGLLIPIPIVDEHQARGCAVKKCGEVVKVKAE